MSRKKISGNVPDSLIEFMEEMNSWELDFFDKRKKALTEGADDSQLKNEYAQMLECILNKYAIKDKANYGRLLDLGCTKPATYDPSVDEIRVTGESNESLTVQIQQVRGAETTSQIQMVKKQDGWKIKRKEILTFDEKWRRAPL